MPQSKKPTNKRLRLPKEGGKIGGVSAALANYFGISVTAVRLVWVFFLFPGGVPGIPLYLILWLIIPKED